MADRYYFKISTKCGTFATMPRIAALSGRSITWFKRVNPNPLTTRFCFTGAQMAETTHFRCIFPATAFGFFVVIANSSIPYISTRSAVAALKLLNRFAAHSGDALPVLKVAQRVKGRFDHVVRVSRADRF